MSELLNLGNLGDLVVLIFLQLVLGFDNLLYISIESKRAPKDKQQAVRRAGILIAGALHLHARSPRGPEASLFGIDTARAVRAAAPKLPALNGPVWVGSYAWTQLTRPYAGVVDAPMEGLHRYALGTDPAEVRGYVMEASAGEPLGRLQELELEPVETIEIGEAWVKIYRLR